MPSVKFYKPDDNINWLVRKFETIRSGRDGLQMTDNHIPRPDIALVFNFESLPEIVAPVHLSLKPLVLTTIYDKPIQLAVRGKLDSFIVICNATVLSSLLKLNLYASEHPFIEVSDARFLQLWQKLNDAKTDSGRIELFSSDLQQSAGIAYHLDRIDHIYLDILENSFRKPLAQIIEKACCSKSTLNRNFLKRCGLSMKKLIRITRVHYIFEKMLVEKQFNYREILYDSNYYDQAHFIKDFREITGETPRDFFAQNSELRRIISGMGEPHH